MAVRISDIILRPAVTEKSVKLAESDKYVFVTKLHASKEEIAKEIKRLFGVDAVAVNTLVLPGKKKRIMGTRKFTKTTSMKKAIVQVKKGQKIDLFPKE